MLISNSNYCQPAKVKLPTEEAVCFDIHPRAKYVTLLSDRQFEFTGAMVTTKRKQRLAVIGVETDKGIIVENLIM